MSAERSQVEQVVCRFGEVLKRFGINTDRMILFGSYAKGTESKYSDIDLVVISRDFEGLTLLDRCTVMSRAITEIMEPIEPRAYTPEEFDRLSPLSVIGSVTRSPVEHLEMSI